VKAGAPDEKSVRALASRTRSARLAAAPGVEIALVPEQAEADAAG
jgi:hypothetical protein